MNYLIEKQILKKAVIKNLESLVDLNAGLAGRVYEKNGARLMAAWLGNAETLLQVTQLFELESLESIQALHKAFNGDNDKDIKQFQELISKADWWIYLAEGDVFAQAFSKAVEKSQSSPAKTYTVACLDLRPDKKSGFLEKQEAAIAMGMPLIAFLCSVTGRRNQVMDIWAGDLQAAGYQTQEYYNAIGMTEEWWEWIRDVAPNEKMERVNMLPYSPLK